jgi:predicted nucleic acid-binding Zn ribbon protein
MDKAGKILGAAVRQLKRPEAPMAWLEAAWPSIVGSKLASHAHPVRLAGGILEVAADARDWLAQLECLSDEFCERINCRWGGALVREVKFVRAKGPGKRPPKEADNEHTPFVRTGTSKNKKAG